MPIVETLAPLILLIGLGAGLAHIRFLGAQFMSDMNKLAFWIALPCLLFVSATHATQPSPQTWWLMGILVGSSLLISGIAWALSFPLGMPHNARGTIMQSAFRGNLAYIGIPVLAYSFLLSPVGDEKATMATAVIIMVLMMVFYNILAVLVLHSSDGKPGKTDWPGMAKTIATNPLVLAGLLGLGVAFVGLPLPRFFVHALDLLGGAAVPLSLLCIGGALATTPLQGRKSWISAAALLKVLVLPVIVFVLMRLIRLDPAEQRIALVVASCPTAAAAYVMVSHMGGDKALASGSIALSTLLSGISLGLALWISS